MSLELCQVEGLQVVSHWVALWWVIRDPVVVVARDPREGLGFWKTPSNSGRFSAGRCTAPSPSFVTTVWV